MGEILSIDNGDRRERVNKQLREILHQNVSPKESNFRLVILIVIMSWFSAYGLWNCVLDIIDLLK